MEGMMSVTPICVYKGCFFVDSIGRAEWFQDKGRMTVRGGSVFLKKLSLRENIIVLGNFRKSWIELKGLLFHLWDENQLSYILKNWGKVTDVAWDSLKLVKLSKVKLWMEMHPNVVLLALLEVEDEARSFMVSVSVIKEEEVNL